MDYFELYLHHCKKLQELLEVDQFEIAGSLQEDFLHEYRILLEREKEALENLISQIKYY